MNFRWLRSHKRTCAFGAFFAIPALLAAAYFSYPQLSRQLPGLVGADPVRGFYYWKTRWVASPNLEATLEANGVNKLYMRFFDVRWHENSHSAMPVSPLKVDAPLPRNVEIIPVVYLVNAVFLNINYPDIELLADRVVARVDSIAAENGLAVKELQLDCDWSDNSRRNYFHFADLVTRKLKARSMIVSSTLRLHQIKYYKRTGIPPVTRGMLMFYNFGRILADSDKSSIFNAQDASRYTSYIASYPLRTDIVLPLFSWSIHSRDGEVLGLLEKLPASDLTPEDFEKVTDTRYKAKRSHFFRSRYFLEGDLLLMEETTPAVTREAARLARKGAGWRKSYDTVALFDLDERNLTKYAKNEINSILLEF